MMNTSVSPFPSPIGSPVSAARADQLVGLVDDLGAGYARFDVEARLVEVNDVFAAWTSVPRGDLVGRHLSVCLRGGVCPPEASGANLLAPTFCGQAVELQTPSGPVAARIRPREIVDAEGHPAGGYWLIEPIIPEQPGGDDRREFRRLRALGALTAGIAHDFNNILTTVLGQAELMELRHGHDLSDDARQRLSRIERSGRQAANLVGQMLSFARQPMEQRARLDLGSVISSAVEILRHGLPEDMHLRKDLRAPMRQIWGSLAEIQLVVVLLCLEIHSQMPQGGTIVLRLEREEALEKKRGWLKLTIADAATDEASEPEGEAGKARLTPHALAEVENIISAHGGRVHIEHERRTVCLLPPFANDEGENDQYLQSSSLDPLKGDGRILLVEDDSAVAETTAQMLRSLGYEVVTAILPSHALQIIRNQSKPFDLVVSDVTMPEMNGYQLADEIARQFGQIPVLFVTGYDFNVSSGSISRVLLQKPLTLQRLGEGVRKVLASASR